MSETLLREIAQSILSEQLKSNIYLYLLMLALSIISCYIAAYLGSYAKKRGENYATKADFDEILRQLKVTTEVAEAVKVKVSHADWATRELKTLKRLKLEELMQSVHETEEWLSSFNSHYIFKSADKPKASPIATVERLTGLYFPELDTEINSYLQDCRAAVVEVLDAGQSILYAASNVAMEKQVRSDFNAVWQTSYKARIKKISDLEKRAREIMIALIETKKD